MLEKLSMNKLERRIIDISYAEKMSPLGNASADDCARYCVSMFSDLSRMVTMQNLFHDGGFSYTGVTQAVIEQMEK
jgi:enoyl-[acyl-carrier protein] reductase I